MFVALSFEVDEDHVMDVEALLGAAIAIMILGIVARVLVALRRASMQDLGAVSRQWIVEQRASQSDNPPR